MKKSIMLAMVMAVGMSATAQTVSTPPESNDSCHAKPAASRYHGPTEEELPSSVKRVTTVRTTTAAVPQQDCCEDGHGAPAAAKAVEADCCEAPVGKPAAVGAHDFRSLDGEELPHSVKRVTTVRTTSPEEAPGSEGAQSDTSTLSVTPDDRSTVSSQMAPPEQTSGKVTRTRTVRTIKP